jgi:hypothetical protein
VSRQDLFKHNYDRLKVSMLNFSSWGIFCFSLETKIFYSKFVILKWYLYNSFCI